MSEDLLRRMCAVLQHRGPDEEGIHLDRQVGLGHRRLSIIDLSTGQQPMSNARQDLWVVYNGEIYNFPELRNDLKQRGYQFLTTSDTEVLLHLYDLYGTACVNHLRGMFAFALWDQRRQRLFLARDRVGKKPLFYHVTAEFIAFASEIKALLQDPAIPRAVNLTALSDYLTYQYVPPPATLFQTIYKLPPAHILVWEQGKLICERYWDLSYLPKVRLTDQEIRIRLIELLEEAVRIRMISDVPIGAFLSGGIDSSCVVALMAQFSSQPVKTFSIGFQEKEFNELPYARRIAERFGTEHHEFIVEPKALEVLPQLIWHFDEPFGDSSAIPTYYVAKMTSQYVKVALNGDGGDESFAGYLRYLGSMFVQYYRYLPETFRKTLADLLLRIPQHRLPGPFRSFKYLNDLSLESHEHLYIRTLLIFPNSGKTSLLTPEAGRMLATHDSLAYILDSWQHSRAEHITDKMLATDVMTYLPGDLLVKMDRMTMAHGLEGRSPFLDHHLMEFAAALPAEYKLKGSRLKYILKEVARTWLPPDILARRKQGFAVPIGHWFRRELREFVQDLMTSSALGQAGILQPAPLQRLIAEHQSGRRDHQHPLWLLLNLELWYRHFIQHA